MDGTGPAAQGSRMNRICWYSGGSMVRVCTNRRSRWGLRSCGTSIRRGLRLQPGPVSLRRSAFWVSVLQQPGYEWLQGGGLSGHARVLMLIFVARQTMMMLSGFFLANTSMLICLRNWGIWKKRCRSLKKNKMVDCVQFMYKLMIKPEVKLWYKISDAILRGQLAEGSIMHSVLTVTFSNLAPICGHWVNSKKLKELWILCNMH